MQNKCSKKMERIAAFIGVYLPGFRSGGPVKSLSNMVEALSDRYTFDVYTSDRDSEMDAPYDGIRLNSPVVVGKAIVYYFSNDLVGLYCLLHNLLRSKSRIFYFNSFFSFKFSILPFLLISLIRSRDIKVLAPRGEFSKGALSIKSGKKRRFLSVARLFGIYRRVIWHASSEAEKDDIFRVFGPAAKVRVATDLAVSLWNGEMQYSKKEKSLKIIFLSRICEMKNLIDVIEIVGKVECHLILDIYGPIEDEIYWADCLKKINKISASANIVYRGSVAPGDVISKIAEYDLFILPSKGENFGHVIAESLFAGVPVLISDCTPWLDMERRNLGWSLSLNDLSKFSACIERCALMPASDYIVWRQYIRAWANENIGNESEIQRNRELFSKLEFQ